VPVVGGCHAKHLINFDPVTAAQMVTSPFLG
jgi:hypothetical protein